MISLLTNHRFIAIYDLWKVYRWFTFPSVWSKKIPSWLSYAYILSRITIFQLLFLSLPLSLSLLWQDSTSVDKSASSSNSPAVPIDKLRHYFRELDLKVLSVLHYGILSRTILDSEQMTKERDELRLRPPQLAFLLQDLSSKLSSTFSLFGKKVGVALGPICGISRKQVSYNTWRLRLTISDTNSVLKFCHVVI